MKPTTHRIERGENLTRLAARYGTTVNELAKLNGIKNVDLIYAGATLKLPGYSSESSFAPSKKAAPSKRPATAGSSAPVSAGDPASGSNTLASKARQVALNMGGYRSQGKCATGVSRAIQQTWGIKVWGNGNQIDDNLPRSKFRQVNMSLEEALKTPGLILTWEKTSTRLGRIYGHTAITSGDGHTTYSDFVERNTTNRGRSGLKIFAPI